MLKSSRTTRGQVVIAFAASIGVAALWVAFDMPIAILPALLIPLWIPIIARQGNGADTPFAAGPR